MPTRRRSKQIHVTLDSPLVYAGPSLWDEAAAHALHALVRQHIDALRRERDWTQKDLADRLGRNQSTISMMLSGQRTGGNLAFWLHLARVFDYHSIAAFFADAEARRRP